MTVVALAVIAAVLAWPARRSVGERLMSTPRTYNGSDTTTGVRRPLVLGAAFGVGGLLLLGGPWWLAVALTVGGLIGARARPREGPRPDELPLLADLMAACMSAGAAPADALAASSVVAGPWLALRTRLVVAALGSGAPASEAWADWLDDQRLAPIARTCIRTSGSGAAAAAELVRVAARLRAARRALGQQRVARASVLVVLPLGACFLPSFVAVGVVPLVVSLVSRLH